MKVCQSSHVLTQWIEFSIHYTWLLTTQYLPMDSSHASYTLMSIAVRGVASCMHGCPLATMARERNCPARQALQFMVKMAVPCFTCTSKNNLIERRGKLLSLYLSTTHLTLSSFACYFIVFLKLHNAYNLQHSQALLNCDISIFVSALGLLILVIASVIPLFKNGDIKEFSNYRPVSILPQFSKILEKVFHNRLMSIINDKQILNNSQFGFRKNMSTALAIIELVEEITTSIDEGKTTVGVFIDFKKAFDTVDHNILIKKLLHYGIRGLAKNWVCSYLENRRQYVCIHDSNSECLDVKCGVPQGSILGPALFILYVNDMCNVSKSLKSNLFAEDTNLLYAGKDLDEVCKIILRELNILHIWFQVNKLSLNVAKTNFMIFGNKRFEENYMISINGMNINRVYVTKFLGVHIDSKLNWNEHIYLISVIKTKVAKNVSIMNRVKHCLICSALYSLYCTLILPYLNYCCEIWGNTYKSRIHPLYVYYAKKSYQNLWKFTL